MAAVATKWLRSCKRSSRNLDFLRRATPFAPSSHNPHRCDLHRRAPHYSSTRAPDPVSSPSIFPLGIASVFGAQSSLSRPQHALLGGHPVDTRRTGMISRVGWDSSPSPSVAAFSRVSSPSETPTSVGESKKIATEKSEEEKTSEEKSLGARIKNLFLALERVPVTPLGLGLAGAIPFVSLTPGIASLLPLPDALFAVHIEAQAAYGAVILTFLGGPHWGLGMAGNDWPHNSKFSKAAIKNVRYIWSVVPSLVAWFALLLNPVLKFAVLITSYLVVAGVDAVFARNGLLPLWYMPMRYLLTGIATLSMTSSLIVSTAGSII